MSLSSGTASSYYFSTLAEVLNRYADPDWTPFELASDLPLITAVFPSNSTDDPNRSPGSRLLTSNLFYCFEAPLGRVRHTLCSRRLQMH